MRWNPYTRTMEPIQRVTPEQQSDADGGNNVLSLLVIAAVLFVFLLSVWASRR